MKKSNQGLARRASRAVGTTVVVILSTAAVLLIALALTARTDDAGITRIAGHPVLTVLSDSMTPTFKAGDLVVGRSSADTGRLSVGDVITFRTGSGDQLITHRIIAVKHSPAGTVYRTQGDANNAPDEGTAAAGDVVSVYSDHIPFGGYVLDAARSKQGMFLLLFIPLLAFLAPEFAKWWRAAGDPAGDQPSNTEDSDELEAVPALASSAVMAPSSERGGGTS